jgi:hypothetical protein
MLCHVALVRTDVSEELSVSFIRVKRIGELGTTLAVTSNRHTSSPILVTLMKEALSSSQTSVLTRATWHNIPEDTILHSDHRENLKSYQEWSMFDNRHLKQRYPRKQAKYMCSVAIFLAGTSFKVRHLFKIHFVTKNFECVHQYVAYITKTD